jgi:hypothetical protein
MNSTIHDQEGLEEILEEPKIRLRTEIAAKVLPELMRENLESYMQNPDSRKSKTALIQESLSWADELIEQARIQR